MLFHNLKKLELKKLLNHYKVSIESFIQKEFGNKKDPDNLDNACLYALEGDGKRFRSSIVLIIAELLNNQLDASYAALSIELFHTASLIADDLPCMDNDLMRRGKAALHQVHGQDVALLASYALIGEGYQCIFKNKEILKDKLADRDERAFIALEMLAQNNSLKGAPSGQFLDLYPGLINQEKLDLIFYRKTVLFFETAFIFGWLFGGGDLKSLDCVREASYHFGMAFQIYDDFCDLNQDKQKKQVINYPIALGDQIARECLSEHIENCREKLKQLNLYEKQFIELLDFISVVA